MKRIDTNQLCLFHWADNRPQTEVVDLLPILWDRMLTGRLQYVDQPKPADVISIWRKAS